jgi:hypothetical protein
MIPTILRLRNHAYSFAVGRVRDLGIVGGMDDLEISMKSGRLFSTWFRFRRGPFYVFCVYVAAGEIFHRQCQHSNKT